VRYEIEQDMLKIPALLAELKSPPPETAKPKQMTMF